ncbi:MAG: GNAT family N-acetyltransferase [Pontibacterium sp.]
MQLERFNPIADREKLDRIWPSSTASEPHSYFLSRQWIDAWLDTLPHNVKIDAHIVYIKQKRLVFFTGRHESAFKQLSQQKRITLNATGASHLDYGLWIEYNGLIGEIDNTTATELSKDFDGIAAQLYEGKWTELYIPGIEVNNPLYTALLEGNSNKQYETFIESSLPSYFVDLQKISTPTAYLAQLSRNTRAQLTRAYREYQSIYKAPLETHFANTTEEALSFFEGLVKLHTQSFEQTKRKSHFTTPFAQTFHKHLISERFSSGEILISQTRCGNRIVGYLYNFIHHGKVSYFQSGLHFENNKHLKPGLVCHHQAIAHLIKQNTQHPLYVEYDFLAGHERLKRSLSNNQRTIEWLTIKKRHPLLGLHKKQQRLKALAKQRLRNT